MNVLKDSYPGLHLERRVWVHGHRGSASTHPENSMPAFEEACDCRANFFEIDIQLTKDRVPVVFHDDSISDRVCTVGVEPVGKPVRLSELSLNDLARFECGRVGSPAFPSRRNIPSLRIPTFDHVLAWAKDKRNLGVNVEIKLERGTATTPESFARIAIDKIRQYNMTGKVQIQSFNASVVTEVKKLLPRVALGLLVDRAGDFVAQASRSGATIIGPDFRLLTPDIVRRCHERGIGVVPWTVNEIEQWKQLLAWNVDGIITDYPRQLVQFLESQDGRHS